MPPPGFVNRSSFKTVDEGRSRLHDPICKHVVGNAKFFPPFKHLLGDLLHSPNKDGRHLQNLLYRDIMPTTHLCDLLSSPATIVCKNRYRDYAQLKLRKTFSCHLL